MKLQRFKLLDFTEDKTSESELSITVPIRSVFRKGNVLPDGVYLWYETPSVLSNQTVTERYKILGDEEVPPDAEFVDLLETTFVDPESNRQKYVIFPLYKLK